MTKSLLKLRLRLSTDTTRALDLGSKSLFLTSKISLNQVSGSSVLSLRLYVINKSVNRNHSPAILEQFSRKPRKTTEMHSYQNAFYPQIKCLKFLRTSSGILTFNSSRLLWRFRWTYKDVRSGDLAGHSIDSLLPIHRLRSFI